MTKGTRALLAVALMLGAVAVQAQNTPIAYRTDIGVPYSGAIQNVDLGVYSLTAAQFVGGGAGLTGVTGTDSTKLPLTGGTVSGTLTTTGGGGIANTYGLSTASAAVSGAGTALVVISSASVGGQLHIGYSQVTNACGAGVTTCTASCPINTVVTGCGNCAVAAVGGLSVDTGGSSTTTGCTCTSLTATTITAYVFCARLNN